MILKKILASAAAVLMISASASFSVWAEEGKAPEEEITEEAVQDIVSGDEEITDESAEDSASEDEEPTGESDEDSTSEDEEQTGESDEDSAPENEDPTDEPDEDSPSEAEEVSAVKEYSVFEAIRIRRDLLAEGKTYTLKDYENVSTFLTNKSELSARYFMFQYDCQDADTKAYKNLKVFEPRETQYKKDVVIMVAQLEKEGYLNMGWEYEGKLYTGGMTFRMPACDVVMTPAWVKQCKITYIAGDYDDIVGNKTDSLTSYENTNYYTAEVGRFSRKGYYISGWKCHNDGIIYKPTSSYQIPSEDVVFEAVWEPASYPLTLASGNAKKDKINLWAQYNTEFVFPECEFENDGKTFAGWKYNKEIYQPGDSFTVPGLISGSKIVISAVWE